MSRGTQDAVDQARRALDERPDGLLPPRERQLVLLSLGERIRGSTPLTSTGHRRRTLVAITAAKKSLPLWQALWPEEPAPAACIAAAEMALDSPPSDPAEVRRLMVDCGRVADQRGEQDPAIWRAGESTMLALASTLTDPYLNPLEFDPADVESQLELDDGDASTAAAIAWAHGRVEMHTGDPRKRREFWSWWLESAVPQACQSP